MPDLIPALFLGGAPKSGTSSVFKWLDDHPDVIGSSPKETDFFADPGSSTHDPDFHVANGLPVAC